MERVVGRSCRVRFKETWLWSIVLHILLLRCDHRWRGAVLHLLRIRYEELFFTHDLHFAQCSSVCCLLDHFHLTSCSRIQLLVWSPSIVVRQFLRHLFDMVSDE